MFYISRPAGSTGPAYVALRLGRAAVESLVNDGGPVGPSVAGLAVIFRVA